MKFPVLETVCSTESAVVLVLDWVHFCLPAMEERPSIMASDLILE